MNKFSSIFLAFSIVVTLIAPFVENVVPELFFDNGLYCHPLWCLSTLLLLTAIICKKIRKEAPYPFSRIEILFFIQVFFGFHPLTPTPLILVLAFTFFYQCYILRKDKP